MADGKGNYKSAGSYGRRRTRAARRAAGKAKRGEEAQDRPAGQQEAAAHAAQACVLVDQLNATSDSKVPVDQLEATIDNKVLVDQLDATIDNKALLEVFALFGTVLSCTVATDARGASLCHGSVTFATAPGAEAAAAADGMSLGSGPIRVRRVAGALGPGLGPGAALREQKALTPGLGQPGAQASSSEQTQAPKPAPKPVPQTLEQDDIDDIRAMVRKIAQDTSRKRRDEITRQAWGIGGARAPPAPVGPYGCRCRSSRSCRHWVQPVCPECSRPVTSNVQETMGGCRMNGDAHGSHSVPCPCGHVQTHIWDDADE